MRLNRGLSFMRLRLTGVKNDSATNRARAFNYCQGVSWNQYIDHEQETAYEELHLGNLLVHLFHKLDDEVHQLVLQHLFGMEVRDQEGYVVSLKPVCQFPGTARRRSSGRSNLDGLPPENEEGLGTLCQEPGKLVDQDVFDLVGLFDLDADPYAVDAGLDEDTLVLVAGNRQGRQQHLGR